MTITANILKHSAQLAQSIGARAIVVYADVFPDSVALSRFVEETGSIPVVLATRGEGAEPPPDPSRVIRVPGIRLTRLGQIKVAVLLGFSRGLFARGDRLVCLSGIAGSGMVDTIVIMEVGEEFEMFAATGATEVARHVNPEVFERVLDLATTLGYEGREGKPVGTTFVIGDTERVLSLSRQMVLNPFKGYPEEERNILDPALEETVKEFAAIDGAFVLRGDGQIEAAGVYLKPGAVGEILPRGLGARHESAAGITAVTDAVAITVSESTGTVTVFQAGKILIELERPRPIGPWTPQEGRSFPGLRGTGPAPRPEQPRNG
ncbi:MAG: diadenylate cyclase [Deferrisomatales bacterium]